MISFKHSRVIIQRSKALLKRILINPMKKIITFYQPTFLKTAIYFNTFLKNLKKLHKLTNELYKILKNGAAKTIKFVALCLACVIYEGIHI